MSSYDSVRANVDRSGGEERVEVNQRALIDKILARYASSGAVYRELLQNSNDAEATVAEVHFTTSASSAAATGGGLLTDQAVAAAAAGGGRETVRQVEYRNNGLPFRPQDWSRLKTVAEGNPDESKIGAFGVGAYAMFSICEEPLVLSGSQALAFVWRGDALWTKTIDNNERPRGEQKWTSFVMPSRDPYPLPDLVEFGEFLCASLTFTKCLGEIRVFVNNKKRMTIVKTQLQEPTVVQIRKNSSWWKKDGAITASPTGLFTLKDENSLLESYYHVQVELDGEVAAVTARYLSAEAKTKIPASMVARMERVTKKKPPGTVTVQIFLNNQTVVDASSQRNHSKGAHQIVRSFSPRMGEGRIFIGFRTSQTTGLGAHLAAPFVPTVEREAMDLQDQTLRVFNLELLEFSGILMRLTLESGMSSLGVAYEKGAEERERLETKLRKEAEEADKQKKKTVLPSGDKGAGDDMTENGETDESTSVASGAASTLFGFAKFMAKGVKRTLVNVVSNVQELVDDGGELVHPRDSRPLCAEEHQAILLMQSFCPRQSTPDPLVGTALAQGFSSCLQDRSPPVLTRSGVVPGDQGRLPNKGMEAFIQEGVIRTIVYQNAEEYHNVIAQCRKLSIDDLTLRLSQEVLPQAKLVRLLKWWTKFTKINPNISSVRGVDLKEKVRFTLDGTDEPEIVYNLKDFLFYLDGDRIRTGGGYSIDDLPMPNSVVPKQVQDEVSLRVMSDASLNVWFSPLPVEIWIDFIANHPCMTSGQPEFEILRSRVLATLGQEYNKRSVNDQRAFGSFCYFVLKDKQCIPFDSTEPTAYSADIPSNLYLTSAELKAFDSIGNFHKVSQNLKHIGVTDDFLLALGVRKSVAIDFLFANLDTLKWSNDPKPLVEYLRSATLTSSDVQKLRSTQYLPSENDVSRMFAPSELYLPDPSLRIFPFLRLLQWPSDDDIIERSQNGKFMVSLGMKVIPPLLQVLTYVSDQVADDTLRRNCLEFVAKKLGSGGSYYPEYTRLGRSDRAALKFLPCVIKSPLSGEEKRGCYSVLSCCSEPRCAIMGFPVLDLGDKNKLYGNLFQCAEEPDASALIQQMTFLVSLAKKALAGSQGKQRVEFSEKVVASFASIFDYMSTRTSDINSSLLNGLANEDFIPCLANGEIQWLRPSMVFFKNRSTEENSDSITESLFQVVDFSPFLAGAGVKQEASTKDIFDMMIQSPQIVLSAVKSEEKYRTLLRRVAAHRPFRRVSTEIREAPFLLSYTVSEEVHVKEKTSYKLAKAADIFVIDNSFFGRMFNVQQAPHESDLEDFYALIGSPYISKVVNKKFDVVGKAQKGTRIAIALMERIQERGPLLVSPSITSRPLLGNAASLLEERNLDVFQAPELKAVYSLKKSTRTQRTSCCVQQGTFKKNSLFVTENFDWFDVGFAIGELILQRCQLEDAFFISSLLEAPLDQLRARGFPVDRIIKPEPPLEPPPKPISKPVPAATNPSSSETATTSPAAHAGTTDLAKSVENEAKSSVQQHPASISSDTSSTSAKASSEDNVIEPPMSKDAYVAILKQMYPGADESYLRDKLGANPDLDRVRSVAEELAMKGYPKDDDDSIRTASSNSDSASTRKEESLAKKLLGSKKLGRAFDGLRSSNFGGLSNRSKQAGGEDNNGSGMAAPPSRDTSSSRNKLVTPEEDANMYNNMERMLESKVRQSPSVGSSGLQSAETTISIPEGLDHGSSCEVIPSQDIKPFVGANGKAESHNGIKIFSARKESSSEAFLGTNPDVVESFAVVLERLSTVFGLPLKSVAIYHDPTGAAIAFNANGALYFNVRYFFGLHYSNDKHQSRACYSYWFVVGCHELAHNMEGPHNRTHAFYTESYASLYLPKLLPILSQMED